MVEKLIYISNSFLDLRKANSVQVTKMSESLGKHRNLILFAHLKNTKDVHKKFGLRNTFKIYKYPTSLRIINVFFSVFKSLIYSFEKKVVVFTRDPLAALLCSLFRLQFVYEVHNLPHSNQMRIIESIFLKSRFLISSIFISKNLKIEYEKQYFRNKKFSVLHDGADTNKKQIHYNKKTRNLDIGYIGHLYKGRGIELILSLADKFPYQNFHLVGGEDEDIKRIKCIKPSNVIVHGYVEPSKTQDFRNSFDILLMPYQPGLGNSNSIYDTSRWMSPLKLFEYMSSGKPIISTDLDVLREVLDDSCSILVSYDLDSWETALMKLIKNPELRKQLGQKAHYKFHKKYTWSKRAKEIIKIIDKVG